MADKQQLDQVLANLLINARDAILSCTDKRRQRTVTIRTSLVELEQSIQLQGDIIPGFYLCMEVSDTGKGIEDELKPLIFEPFFTTKGEGKGTGLGLSTVFGVVKQNKGTIHVYSEHGLGTTFRIYWPAMKTKTELQLEEQENTRPLAGHETLLLVEDEDDVRNFAVEVLTDLGYRITGTHSGEEALQLLINKQFLPQLLVTDVVLPGMNGKQLAAGMRDLLPDLPVLYTSGYTSDILAQHGMLEDGIELLEKPYSIKLLSGRIREVLDQK